MTMRLIRRLYDWVLHWANTPYGTPALFLLAFAEASCFPVPPDVLLMALCLSQPARSFRFALVCTLGSVSGGVAGYFLGMGLWSLLREFFFTYVPGFTPEIFARVQHLFENYGFWTVFTAGFTPIPYKVITIGAGVFQIGFVIFLFASVVSRGLRFFLVAGLLHRYGEPMRTFIDRHFNWLTLAFCLLLIGGFIVIKALA